MATTYFALFVAFAAVQAVLTVKLADWLSSDETTGRAAAEAVPAEGLAGFA